MLKKEAATAHGRLITLFLSSVLNGVSVFTAKGGQEFRWIRKLGANFRKNDREVVVR